MLTVFLKVVAYAAIPLTMAWIGNHLAAESITDKKERRAYRIAFIVLAVLGISVSGTAELMSDRDHAKELSDGRSQVSELQNTLQINQVQNARDMVYLKTKLDDQQQINDQLAKFGPSIYKLAEVTEEYTRKQYQAKVLSDQDLYNFTMGVVKKLRDFSVRYDQQMRQLEDQQTTSFTRGESQAEMLRVNSEFRSKEMQLFAQRDDEFRTSVYPEALYAHDELLKKGIKEPTGLPMFEEMEAKSALSGLLAGPSPTMAFGDYLEIMAKGLHITPQVVPPPSR